MTVHADYLFCISWGTDYVQMTVTKRCKYKCINIQHLPFSSFLGLILIWFCTSRGFYMPVGLAEWVEEQNEKEMTEHKQHTDTAFELPGKQKDV